MARFSVTHNAKYEKFIKKIQERMDEVYVFDSDLPEDGTFTFVDFASPRMFRPKVGYGTYLRKYHELVDFANEWLTKHVKWQVISCEVVPSIIRIVHDEHFNEVEKTVMPNSLTIGSGFFSSACLLRLWLKARNLQLDGDDEEGLTIQQIKHIDFVPQKTNSHFESIDDVVKRININIATGQIVGTILSIQTVQCAADVDWNIDTEDTETKISFRNVYVIRIFLDVSSKCLCREEIGLIDFVPEYISGGTLLQRPKFEPQTSVLERASLWVTENPQFNFCSAQTIDVRLKSMTSIDSKQMAFTSDTGDFLRVLRVAYTKHLESPSEQSSFPSPIYLSTFSFPIITSVADLKQTISNFFSKDEWLNQRQGRPRFLNFESFSVLAANFRDFESNIDHSFVYNRINTGKRFETSGMADNNITYFAVRVYFDRRQAKGSWHGTNRFSCRRLSKIIIRKRSKSCVVM